MRLDGATEIGSTLQEARLHSALTLREISKATKISLSVLESIERNDFSRLPGGVFMRGYLRAYAGEVGLNPDHIVNAFRAQFEHPEQEEPLKLRPPLERETKFDRLSLLSMLTLGLLLAIYFAFVSRSAESPSESETVEAVTTTGEARIPSEVLEDVPLRVASPALPGDAPGLQLELQSRGVCWVSAIADGRLVIYRLMQPGERATLDARDQIQLRVGDAGAFAFVINGAPGRPLGRPGEAVSLRITKGNYEAFQAGSPLGHYGNADAPAPGSAPQEIPSSRRQGNAA